MNSGESVDGVLVQDVQNTSFGDEEFDLITCNQVFEHVADDLRGFAECHRILRPGGALIFAIPLSDAPATERMAEVVDGEVVHLAPPEYHNSRIAGPGSALVFWRHSLRDIAERVGSVGFEVDVRDVSVLPSLPEPAKVIVAVKPQA
jgi:predicted SAM-dependent methyltransferase